MREAHFSVKWVVGRRWTVSGTSDLWVCLLYPPGGPHWNTIGLNSKVRVTTLSGLGNRKRLEDTSCGALEYSRCVVDSTCIHYLMAIIKVEHITTQKPTLPTCFWNGRKTQYSQLGPQKPSGPSFHCVCPWEGVCCGPEMIGELCRKLSFLRGLISRDWGRGVVEDRSLRTYQSRSNFP